MSRRARLGLTAALGLALGLESSAAVPPPDGFLSSVAVSSDNPDFGGLSAIEVSDDGLRFVALTDRGRAVSGRILRDAEGRATGVEFDPMMRLHGRGITPLASGRTDSEGLAIAPDGTAFVSFEGAPRVLGYRSLNGPAENLPTPPEFQTFRRNAALEALAIDAAGRLYTLPEDTRSGSGDFPVFRFDGTAWSQPFALPRQGDFLPVGADFGPDGRLYILEREFHGIAGFASRVRALTLGDGGTPVADRIVMQSPTGYHDNLEGIAVWSDSLGRIRLTMISDDNFLPWQQSEIVEYALPVLPDPDPDLGD